jgi:pyruvate kinase
VAVSSRKKTCQELLFSYGVLAVFEPNHPRDWRRWIGSWLKANDEDGRLVVLTEGPSAKYPDRNNRMEIILLDP